MQHGIVPDGQPVCFTDRDAMGMAIHNDIVLDQNVLIIHLLPSLACVYQFVAHENRLGVCAVADIQPVVADDDVGAGRIGASGPELDHVPVIGRIQRAEEVVDVVVFDHQTRDLGKIHAVHPNGMQIVALHHEVTAFRDDHPTVKIENLVVFDRHVRRSTDREADRIAIAVIDFRNAAGHIPIEG